MKIKKFISLLLIFTAFLSLSGCSDKKIKVSINSGIIEYSPTTSSVPGIPLNAIFKTNIKNENVKFHWVTEQGTFLKWQQDNGIINILGKNIKTNEQTLYWSVVPNEKIEKSFKIYLIIEDIDSSKVISEARIQIEQNKEGLFLVKK
ncbi:hypothetical protein [Clostridium lacusfryxellense]|uniref:hypothetical protein n=1 Tax=Clostridium lacusfryxellense TaxID=205328 RepID=UPI001C0ABD98|nr:hypothetical protein [Clostridium lacusfryxellense]MBU3113588.1 hypothetical protein [Clostridium lacusfryxellense]